MKKHADKKNGLHIDKDGNKEWWVDGTYLGVEDKGFWNLWDRLSNKQRSNLNLLMHLPIAVKR